MFTIDELTIIKLYGGDTMKPREILAKLLDSVFYIDEEAVRGTVETTIFKMAAISDQDFAALDFSDVLDGAVLPEF